MIEALENAANEHEALVAALAAWRQLRDPQLASIVEHLGARVRSAAIPKMNLHAEWLARAASAQPNDVEALLESLGRQADDGEGWWPIRPTRQRFAKLIERVGALSILPDDPRVARALTEIVRRSPWSVGWQGELSAIYDPILALIGRANDPRSIDVLAALRARPVHRVTAIRNYLEGALPTTLAQLSAAETIDEALRARIAAVAERLGVANDEPASDTSSASGDDLLAAIYCDPDDDGAREVYADWLLERKDPRGELIALQFAEHRGTATAKEKKRSASLIRAHQNEWLGEVAIVTKKRVFRRGFLDEAELMSQGSATPDLWDRVLADERLSTIRVLHKGKANEPLYNRFLASPMCRSLRRVSAMTSATVEALVGATGPLRIETVRLDRPSRESLNMLASSTTLPALHTLEILIENERADAVLQSVMKSGICARLRGVTVDLGWRTHVSQIGPLIATLETLGLQELRINRYSVDVGVRLEGDARVVSLSMRSGYELLDIVQALPQCARIELSSQGGLPDAQRALELREALLSRAKEIVVDGFVGPVLGFPGGTA